MNKLFLLYFLLTAILYDREMSAQIYEVAMPFSISNNLDAIQEFEDLPVPDILKSADEDSLKDSKRLKIRRFAKLIEVDFCPEKSGVWNELPEGRVWRLGIRSSQAYSLYLVFGRYKINAGVKLFVYNTLRTDFAGAFTNASNNQFNVLTVAPLQGESLIIELNIPAGISDYGELKLTQVWHDYLNEFGDKSLKSTVYEPSENCNIDISCQQGTNWQTEKNAVCRLLANGSLCTGTLLNNTSGENIPYLITACHCVEDSATAASAIYFFGYERPLCNKPGGEKSFTLSGSTLVATTDRQLDFSLLKLNQFPPAAYEPYFAGWDAGGDTPENVVCIHHPNGDVKKISVDYDQLITGDFGEGFSSNSHWLVTRWEYGSTEGGSSGAPLFDNTHRLCGTLTGGDATCKNPINDFFAKFNLSWDYFPEPSNQLKYWLDPLSTGKTSIDGKHPYEQSQNQLKTYTNTKGEYAASYTNNLTWGTISGHNSSGFSQFAEKYYAPSSFEISGMFLGVTDRYFSDIFSYFTLKIWKGSDKPSNEIYSQDVYLRTLIRSAFNYYLFDSPLIVSDTFFVGFSIDYQFSDTIKAFTAADRGANGSSNMYVYNGEWYKINEVTWPQINTSLMAGILSSEDTDPSLKSKRTLKIAPNPCIKELRIEFSDEILPVSFKCYDLTGRPFYPEYELIEIGIRMNVSNLPAGIYLITVNTNNERVTERFTVIK